MKITMLNYLDKFVERYVNREKQIDAIIKLLKVNNWETNIYKQKYFDKVNFLIGASEKLLSTAEKLKVDKYFEGKYNEGIKNPLNNC